MSTQHGAPKTTSQRTVQKRLDELLDQALADTFPASDPPAMLEPVPHLEDEQARRPPPGSACGTGD